MLEHYKEILCYIQRLTRDKDLAQDLAQDTYIKAIEVDRKSDIKIKKSYLYKIAYNLVIDKFRRNKIITQTEYDEDSHTIPDKEIPEAILTKELRDKELKKCIENLPKKNKEAFVMYLYMGYSRKEIAEVMGISINAVEKNITRATSKIKEQMMRDNI